MTDMLSMSVGEGECKKKKKFYVIYMWHILNDFISTALYFDTVPSKVFSIYTALYVF